MSGLIILRPQPGADASVAAARAIGLSAVACPLFRVDALPWIPPEASFDALLITSANALLLAGAGMDRYRDLPVYAVGQATGRAAEQAGFAHVSVGGGTVADTLPLMQRDAVQSALHLCGTSVRPYDSGAISVTRVVVYDAAGIGSRADILTAAASITSPVSLLLHSPRAGDRVSRLLEDSDRAGFSIVAISDAAALAAGPGWASVHVAAQPDDKAMLALAAKLCDEPRL